MIQISKLVFDRLIEKSCPFKKKDKDYTVNKIPCLLTRWLLPLNLPLDFLHTYTGPLDLRVIPSRKPTRYGENAVFQDR
ncbi:hypothetical protein DAPPUDRAFT_334140 [Daphnia pulex]|uniref:Uncharacterized protein n=1 Tax=Daphnia pulex TaxID=6669 RepID=E9HUU7_DAPPU|nr:hypothetical protein DAPPUDRAFT_334140 [Daphnia pulex]|eukprot:EFX64488.1 hypothetical protein DAPPUDRAFT_334140 [Daphnia pulex]